MGPDHPLSAAERRRIALEQIDNAKFSWYHVRYIHLIILISEQLLSRVSDCMLPFF